MRRLILVVLFISGLALAQDKPRVFVQGKGSEDTTSSGSGGGGRSWGAWGSKSTVDSHDESMEVTKDLQKNCSGVLVTLNQNNADYTVMLNRESRHNRGLLRSNSQIRVANRLEHVLGASATHTVGNPAKDACELVVADWTHHGRIATPHPPAAASAPAPATAPAPAQGARLETVSAVQTEPAASPATATTIDNNEAGHISNSAQRI